MNRTNKIKVTKLINAPLSFVYGWCTDYRADDSTLTSSKFRRVILEKTRKRVIYVESFAREGKQLTAVDIVTLKPPSGWHLDYVGQDAEEAGDYRLRRLGPRRTRLEMTFTIKYKLRKPPTKTEEVKQTSAVWDGYVSALEKEYRSKKN